MLGKKAKIISTYFGNFRNMILDRMSPLHTDSESREGPLSLPEEQQEQQQQQDGIPPI